MLGNLNEKIKRYFLSLARKRIWTVEIYFLWPLGLLFGPKLLKQLTPYDANGFEEKIRIGGPYDGGYVMPINIFSLINVMYSYGVGDSVAFEEDLLNHIQVPVRLYDHTVAKLPKENTRFFFKQEGIGVIKSEQVDTFKNHVAQNHDEGKKILLKMDIEGDEWKVLDQIIAGPTENIMAVIIEIHKLYRYEKGQQYAKTLAHINSKFTLVHIHGNNLCAPVTFGKTVMPDVCELTFVNNNLVNEKTIMASDLPGENDSPNNPDKKDIILNFWKKHGK